MVDYMSLSAKEAAKAVGMTKQGVIKSIKDGKISAKKDENGHWIIDPSELFRVHSPINQVDSQPVATSSLWLTGKVDSDLHLKNTELTIKLEAANKEIFNLQADKEDYKRRLDRESEERRKLTMMLTDMREKPPTKPLQAENENSAPSAPPEVRNAPRSKIWAFVGVVFLVLLVSGGFDWILRKYQSGLSGSSQGAVTPSSSSIPLERQSPDIPSEPTQR